MNVCVAVFDCALPGAERFVRTVDVDIPSIDRLDGHDELWKAQIATHLRICEGWQVIACNRAEDPQRPAVQVSCSVVPVGHRRPTNTRVAAHRPVAAGNPAVKPMTARLRALRRG